MAAYKQEEYQLASKVNAFDYLKATGHVLERSGSEYQLKEHDSLKVGTNGKWYWHSRDIGGESAILLVHELEGISKPEAIKKLAEFAGGADVTSIAADRPKQKPKKQFDLPGKYVTTDEAYSYLTKVRGIDGEIVRKCIEQGLIYESAGYYNANYHNVVFVGQRDDSGRVKHASLRGMVADKPFKRDVSGSDKAYSFVLPGENDTLVICESAIDVLSQATITKLGGGDWTADHRLALGGMSDSSLERYLEKYPEIKNLVFALDNDKNAVDKDGNPDNHGQKRAAKLIKMYKEKGYTVFNTVTEENDLNESLLALRKKENGVNKSENASKGEPIIDSIPDKNTEEQNAGRTEVKMVADESTPVPVGKSNAAMDELWAKLEDGVKAVYTSENYLNYLKFAAKFYRYSVANCLLIAMQMSTATRVAGYQAWKTKFGRTVKKGEKGIQILAPMKYSKLEQAEVVDKSTGEIVTQNQLVEKKYFKPVYVFDVSQTEGKELPRLANELNGEVEQYEQILKRIEKLCQYPIVFEQMNGSMKGYFSLGEKRIAIKAGMSQAHTLKTAIHELAHSRMHVDSSGKVDNQSKDMKEVQAESVAFIVSSQLGLDTSEYSFPYIATYSSMEMKELKESLRMIQKESAQIIQALADPDEKELTITKKNDHQEEDKTKLLANQVSEIQVTVVDEQLRKMQLFRDGYQKDPMQVMEIFGHTVKDNSLNEAILFKDPLIKNAVTNGTSVKACIRTIEKQIAAGNAVLGKVKVQIGKSEAKLPQGEFYSLVAANKLFGKYEAKAREEARTDQDRGYDKVQFGLYIEKDGIWHYGMSRFNIGDGYAQDLMDYIRKTMDPDIIKVCEKELYTQQKKLEKQKEKVEQKEERSYE